MADYRLSNDAEEDLIRIHQWGVRHYGEARADAYYHAFFERFEQIAQQPYMYQTVDHIRQGYRRCICGVDSIYYRIEGDTVEIMTIIGHQNI